MYIPDPQQHVLRLHIFTSQDSDCENALTMHVMMGTLNPTNSHNVSFMHSALPSSSYSSKTDINLLHDTVHSFTKFLICT